jgi:ATP-binding cassette subfamily B protein
MYSDGVSHSLEIPYAELERRRSGDTISQLQRMRREVELFVTASVNVLFTSFVGLTFVVAYASQLHWTIPVFLVLTAPALMFFSVLLSRKVGSIQKQIVEQGNAMSGAAGESLRNVELVKSLGLTDNEVSRFRATSDQILKLELRRIRYARMYSLVHGAGVHVVRISLFLLLLDLLSMRLLTVGQFFSLFLYSYFIIGPMQEFGAVVSQYRELEASLVEFGRLLDHPREIVPVEPVSINELEQLEFADVSFTYGSAVSAKRPAIQKINFRAAKGEMIAFVGQSGAGKSTLIKLLSGLYPPSQGEILFNGICSSHIEWDSLRKKIGLVTQETHLFSGTVRDNLKFAAPDATEQECLRALEGAAATSLCLDAVIGEAGMQLSGGERQRLSIARALLRKPQLIVFDEATSAVDSITEHQIGKTIRAIAAANQIITIVISHRLTSVMQADRIHTLAYGHIVEAGTHDELLAHPGPYRTMWQSQIGPSGENAEAEAAQRHARLVASVPCLGDSMQTDLTIPQAEA